MVAEFKYYLSYLYKYFISFLIRYANPRYQVQYSFSDSNIWIICGNYRTEYFALVSICNQAKRYKGETYYFKLIDIEANIIKYELKSNSKIQ